LAALLAVLIGTGLASQLVAGMARADPGQNPAAPCIPANGYPNTPDTRKVGNLTAQQLADLKKDILEAIIFKETKGVATESKMKTSSGVAASYKSLVQTTEPTALTTLLGLPANQLAGFKPNVGDGQALTRTQLQSAQRVSDAAVFLWEGMRAAERPNEAAQAAAAKAGTKVPANITADDVLAGTFKGHKNETSRATAGLNKDNVTTMLDFYRNWVPIKNFPKPPLEDGCSWARRAVSQNSATSATAAKVADIVTRPDADGRAGLALGRTVVDNAFDSVLKANNLKTLSVDDFVDQVGRKHNGSGPQAAAYGKDLVKQYHQKMQARQNNATKPCPKAKKSTAPPKPKAPNPPKPRPATPPATVPPAPGVPSASLPDGAGTPCFPEIEDCPGYSGDPQLVDPGYDPGYDGGFGGGGYGGGCDYGLDEFCVDEMKVA
jgi:hypothetical protein